MDQQPEIIHVSLDLFRALEHDVSASSLDDTNPLHIKIKALLCKYTCFHAHPPQDTSGTPATKYYNREGSVHNGHHVNNHHTNSNQHRRNQYNQHHQPKASGGHAGSRPAHLTKFTSGCGDKHLNGLLNKVTLQNYAVVRAKLSRMSMIHSPEEIVSTILKKCLSFGSYAFLYHRLVDEFYHAQPDAVHATILSFLDNVVDGLPVDISRLRCEPSTTAYDDYCAYVKSKDALFSKMKTVCMLDAQYNHDRKIREIREVCFCAFDRNDLTNADFSYIHLLTSLLQLVDVRDALHYAKLAHVFEKLQVQFPQLPMNTVFAWQRLLASSS